MEESDEWGGEELQAVDEGLEIGDESIEVSLRERVDGDCTVVERFEVGIGDKGKLFGERGEGREGKV